MRNRSALSLLLLVLLQCAPALAGTPPEWSKAYDAHRIAGPVYYVGTAELGCYLIRGSQGDILINTGLEDSPALITASIRALGFDPRDVRILLTNQAHFDHVGGFARMQELTGAKVFATAGDAPLLLDGGASDPSGFHHFKPVKVDRVLKDGDVITLGDVALTVISTPGHSPGSVSYQMALHQGGQERSLLFANLPSVVMPLKNPKYVGIVADLRSSFARLKALKPDLWVAAHASQFDLAAKHSSGKFEDAAGYATAVRELEEEFEAKVRAELGP